MTTRRQNNKARLNYKPLESRQMLATVAQPAIIVDTIDDVVDATDGVTSLREAIILANSADGSVSSITFDNSLSGQAISLNTTLPFIEADITFDGDLDDDLVSDITVQGTDLVVDMFTSGVFTVRDATVVFDGLSFEGLSGSDESITSVIDAARATVSIVNSNFDGNTFSSDSTSRVHSGGLRSVESDIFIDNSSFTNNFGRDAGAIHSSRSTLTVLNSIFEGNSGSLGNSTVGAILHTSGGDVFVDNSSFVNNVAGSTGGLIIINSPDLNNPGLPAPSATISNSVITGNESIVGAGGVRISGVTTEIINSTISSNITESTGGGISFSPAFNGDAFFGSLTVVNSTIAGNTAGGNGGGVIGGGHFVNSTVTGNFSSGSGGGIDVFAPTLDSFRLENSIVLGNYSGFSSLRNDISFRNFNGTSVNAVGSNIVGPNQLAPSPSLIDADPTAVFAETEPNVGNSEILAGVLADNGGTVQTVALLDVFDNPALDVGGLPVGLTTDATGNLRSVDLIGIDNGGTVDAGAFELQTQVDVSSPAIIGGDLTASLTEEDAGTSGVLTISDANGAAEEAFIPTTIQSNFGQFSIEANGEWTFSQDPLGTQFLPEGQEGSVVFRVTSVDGTPADVRLTIVGVNDPATIGGELSGQTDADSTTPVSGTATVNDIDTARGPRENNFQAGSQTGTYGTLEIELNGDWTYQLDNDLTSSILAGEEVTDEITIASVDGTTAVVSIAITGTAEPEPIDPLVLGTDGDDTLFGSDGDDVLVGGTGSDTLVGSEGDDIFFTDQIDGDINRNDQDVVDLGNLDDNATGNDVIRDFDINEGAENNFDTLDFTFLDNVFSLSTGDDILDFIDFIETDGDRGTDAIQDGNDLIFVFARDSENPDIITQSVRLEDVIGGRSLTDSDIAGSRISQIGSFESDVLAANGSILFGDASSSSLSGGDDDDVLVGGTGSDVLLGGAGNDILTGDQTDGGSGGQDQDTFVFGDIDQLDIGNDVITDFDTDNFRGGESNFDTATFTFGGQDFTLDTGFSFILLIRALRDDGNADTEAILDDDDILLVFSRDENGAVTESIRFQDIVGDDGLNTGRLNRNNIGQITNETV